jgi:hypothetical protein
MYGRFVDTYRTLCLAPTPEMKAVFDGLQLFSLLYKIPSDSSSP